MTTLALAAPRRASPLLWNTALAFALSFAAFYTLTFIDPRLFNGVSVWEKPAKFFLSLAVHSATLAWGITLIPDGERFRPAITRLSALFVGIALFELTYITLQAARGEASHFNVGTPLASLIYSLMGAGAVGLCAITGYFGWRILRSGGTPMHLAAGASFIAAGALTVIVAGYLGGNGGHWVGGDQTDATGLAFFHWSTTGGDLRVAHFVSLHLMQAVPLAAFLWPSRRVVTGALALGIAITLALFVQALMGVPLLRA